MKTSKTVAVNFAALTVIALMAFAPRAEAIPLFAHKYNTTCFTCHTTPPVLNEFGRRFQANGYQLPGTIEKIALWDQPTFAFGAVAQPMVIQSEGWIGDSSTGKSTTFSGIEVALFSSASLGAHLSYFAAVPVSIADGNTSIEIETANLMYSDLLNDGTGSVNLRLGKFRFFVPFPENVMLTNPGIDPPILVNGYDAFDGKDNLVKANDLVATDPTFGASAFGMIPGIAEGLRWEVGMTGGNSSDIDLTTAKAYFASLDQTFYVDNAPLRISGFYYTGSQGITDSLGVDSLSNTISVGWTNHTVRGGVGVDFLDPFVKRLDFFGEYMVGKDDNVDTVGVVQNMSGGFAGVNVIVLPEKLYVYGRYDFRTVKETSDAVNQIDVGIQYHLLPNVFLTGVYSVKNETIPQSPDQKTTTFGAGVRFGF
ncbi:MAG: hypothetical protein Q8922_00135 [Bacteroidota bacterium]|nr:hypothetical protein [Bacteroidota bacterium]MDP4232441.1 hypothetical protein [Bacteroidota bacterium]MDP4241577.1 hypothetical protein [Bacteroidota bacterium]MDP4286321.1 hypothetical protein [Bacteroidota bacterium]